LKDRASIWKIRRATTGERSLGAVIGVLFAILLVLVVDAGIGGGLIPERTVTVSITQTTSIALSSAATYDGLPVMINSAFSHPSGGCLLQVPQNSTIGGFGAAVVDSVYATLVTYPDGINASFPVVGCPQPVASNYYQRAVLAVTNSSFSAMEKGSEYYYAGIGPTVTLPGNRSASALLFNTYSNATEFSSCTTYGRQILGQIQVFFFPSTTNATPVLTDPHYSYMPGSSLQTCP